MVSDAQRQFLLDEFFEFTLAGAFQRARIYGGKAGGDEEQRLHCRLRHELEALAPGYGRLVLEYAHRANIEALSEGLTASFAPILQGGRFRIGVAQKALSLYLKYLWCWGEIAVPPHCPFDSQVLAELGGGELGAWTKCDSWKTYGLWVDAARERATQEGVSIAEWELSFFNKSRHPSGVAPKLTPRAER